MLLAMSVPPTSGFFVELSGITTPQRLSAAEEVIDAAEESLASAVLPALPTIAAMIATHGLQDGQMVEVLCYSEPGDLGGGRFSWDESSVEAVDNGLVFPGDVTPGRWLRQRY